jgi:hypothetical protein
VSFEQAGMRQRTTAATLFNTESSRSHAVFELHVTSKYRDARTGHDLRSSSRLSLVELHTRPVWTFLVFFCAAASLGSCVVSFFFFFARARFFLILTLKCAHRLCTFWTRCM